MGRKSRKLRAESLESRQMMAGDVTAWVESGTLYVTEADGQIGQANEIRFSQIAEGRIRIEGIGDDGTLVNGAKFWDVDFNGNLDVKLGAGNDMVQFDNLNSPEFNNVRLDLGFTPVTTNAKFSNFVDPSAIQDDDRVQMENFHTLGALTILTGSGHDLVSLIDAVIGATGNTNANLYINTGAGSDTVRLRTIDDQMYVVGKVDIQTYENVNEAGDDVVRLNNTHADGDMSVRTGGGNDQFFGDNAGSVKTMLFDMGNGNDQATYANSYGYLILGLMGAGDDTLTTWGLDSTDGKFFDGGSGNDILYRGDDWHNTPRSDTGFERINPSSQTSAFPGTGGGVLART